MTQLIYRPPPGQIEPAAGLSSAAVRTLPITGVVEVSAERWDRWIARGLKQDRIVQRRFQLLGLVAAVLVIAALLFWLL